MKLDNTAQSRLQPTLKVLTVHTTVGIDRRRMQSEGKKLNKTVRVRDNEPLYRRYGRISSSKM